MHVKFTNKWNPIIYCNGHIILYTNLLSSCLLTYICNNMYSGLDESSARRAMWKCIEMRRTIE